MKYCNRLVEKGTVHNEELIPFKAVEKIGRQTTIQANGNKRYNVKIHTKGNKILDLNMLYDEDDPKSFDSAISFIQSQKLVEVTNEKSPNLTSRISPCLSLEVNVMIAPKQ